MERSPAAADNRLSVRYAVHRRGRALNLVWRECTVVDAGKRGIGIRMHNSESMAAGTTVYLEIDDPRELKPLCLTGTLRWIEREGRDCIGGIELATELEGHLWVALRGPFVYRPPKRAHFY